MSSLTQLIGALVAFYIARCAFQLYRNVQQVKKIGIPYMIVPICPHVTLFRFSSILWGPWLEGLPGFGWVHFTKYNWHWDTKFEFYEKYGEIVAVVSPGSTQLLVADPVAMWDIANKRVEFPKDIAIYRAINIYGRNVVTTEGKEWRLHRKVTSPPFSEKNNSNVFYESLRQAHEAANYWNSPTLRKDLGSPKPVNVVSTLAADFMRVSLQVISKAGFSRDLQWPSADGSVAEYAKEGHKMTFQESLAVVLHNIFWYIITPKWFLRISPFKFQQEVYTAVHEWKEYMLEIYNDKKERLMKEGPSALNGNDLMDSLVPREVLASSTDIEKENGLTLDEILGNTYVFMLAGHETTAHTMHYTLIFLALNPQYQREIQKELDSLFPDRTTKLDYERDYPKLADGWINAALNETLRLYQPVLHIPKTSHEPHILRTRDYGDVMIPPGWAIELSAIGVHRNPRYWSPDPDSYRPDRWFISKQAENVNSWRSSDGEEERLKKPARGSFFPFSEGFRACLGKKFAQVEMVAVMAEFLRNHSVELVVDEKAGDKWEAVAEQTKKDFNNCFTGITLYVRKEIPLAVVKRGDERFGDKIGGGSA